MTARRVLLLSPERFYGGFASCFIPWPWEFLKHVLNSLLDCTLIWIAEYVLGDFVFSMAGRSVYGMLYTFIEHSVYKCDRLDWTRPPRASMLKKTSYSFLFILQYKSCAFGRRELEFHFLNPAKVLEPFCDATWNVTQYSFKLGLKLAVCDIFRMKADCTQTADCKL